MKKFSILVACMAYVVSVAGLLISGVALHTSTTVTTDVEVAAPPTSDKMYTILTQAVGVAEFVLRTDSVDTTPEAAFATDLTTAQQSNAYVQQFTVLNTHATQNICVKPIAWTEAGASCTAKCAAQTITCSGAATDGKRVGAGSEWPASFDGTSCVCVVGSAAGTTYQTTRVLR